MSDSDLSHAATIGWVSNHIATALSPFAVDINNRIQNIIQQDASTLYAAIESAICNKIRLDNNGDSGCNFVSSGYTLAGALNPAAGATSQEIHLVKAAPAAMTSIVSFRASCRDSGVCDQLCINGTCKTAWPPCPLIQVSVPDGTIFPS